MGQHRVRKDGVSSRRSLMCHSLDALEHPESRAEHAVDELWRRATLAAQLRQLVDLRTGDRKPESPRFRDSVSRTSCRRLLQLEILFSAGCLPGHIPGHSKKRGREPRRQHSQQNSSSGRSASAVEPVGKTQPSPSRDAKGRPVPGSSHRLVRIGIPHAIGSHRRAGSLKRNTNHPHALRN